MTNPEATPTTPLDLGPYGVWRPLAPTPDIAVELENLGYRTLWLANVPVSEFPTMERLLDATEHLILATGIVNIWASPAPDIIRAYHHLTTRHPNRFLLGIGAGHREMTQEYTKPYDALTSYLDALDEAEVPVSRRALAALGPRVMRLAGTRTWGAHPYLVTPEHTRRSRELLGPDALLAPEQTVALAPADSRELAAKMVGRYLALTNYTNNLKTLGYDDEDVTAPGSDRLLNDLVLQGTPEKVAAGLRAHVDAGANHVAIQALGEDPLPTYRALAKALDLSS